MRVYILRVLVASLLGTMGLDATVSLSQDPILAQRDQLVITKGDPPLPKRAICRIGTTRFRHSSAVEFLAFSPHNDLLVSGGADGIRVWSLEDARQVYRLSWKHRLSSKGRPRALMIDPRGKYLVVNYYDSESVVHDLETGKILAFLEKPVGGTDTVEIFCFSTNGNYLAGVSQSLEVLVWEVKSWRIVLKSLNNSHSGFGGAGVAFHPSKINAKHAALVYGDWRSSKGEINLFQLVQDATGKAPFAIIPERRKIAIPPEDGKVIVTGWRETFLLDPKTANSSLTLPGGGEHVATDRDGSVIAVGLDRNTRSILVFSTKDARRLAQLEPSGQLASLAMSRDGSRLAAGTSHGIVEVWNVAAGKPLFAFDGFSNGWSSGAFLSDGTIISCQSRPSRLVHFDPTTGQVQKQFPAKAQPVDGDKRLPSGLGHWKFSSNGSRLIIRDSLFLTVIDTRTGEVLNNQIVDGLQGAKEIAMSGNDEEMVELTWNSGLDFWARSLRPPISQLQPNARLERIVLSHSGKRLVASHEGKWRLSVIDVSERMLIHDFGAKKRYPFSLPHQDDPGDTVRSMAFLGPKEELLTAGVYSFSLIDPRNRHVLHEFACGDDGSPNHVFSSPSGLVFATAYDDQLVLWEAFSRQSFAKFQAHDGAIGSLRFSADGSRFLTGGADNVLIVWNLDAWLNIDEKETLSWNELWRNLGDGNARLAMQSFRSIVRSHDKYVDDLTKGILQLASSLAKTSERIHPAPGPGFAALRGLHALQTIGTARSRNALQDIAKGGIGFVAEEASVLCQMDPTLANLRSPR